MAGYEGARWDLWEAFENRIRDYNDERLLGEWEEAKRLDAEDPYRFARMTILDRLKSGHYWEKRKAERLREQRRQDQQRTRARALEEGAAATFPSGRQLAAERSRAGLSQAELARATGFLRTAISKIEKGTRRLAFDEACRLADALGIPLDRLRPA